MLRPTQHRGGASFGWALSPTGQANLIMLILQFLHGVGMLLAEPADAPIAPEESTAPGASSRSPSS